MRGVSYGGGLVASLTIKSSSDSEKYVYSLNSDVQLFQVKEKYTKKMR